MKSISPNPRACWLTTNRACNLRCQWCYAADTGFSSKDDMPFETAKKIVDICGEAHIGGIILLGGEPTLYPHILEVISYCKSKNIQTTVVTNGIVFADKAKLQQYLDAGMSRVGISLKAHDSASYKNLTGVDAFEITLQAISNLTELGAKFSVSTVLTGENMPEFLEGLVAAKQHGAKSFGLSFCYNFDANGQTYQAHLQKNNPYALAKKFQEIYPKVCEALRGTYFSLEQSLPECVWEEKSIHQMQKDKHIHSICQLMSGSGVLFDNNGFLIPCNAMHTMKYGKLGEDFDDWEGLIKHLQKPEVVDMFSLLRGAPDESCLTCQHASTCGGGCVTNWTNYSFAELQELKPKN